MDIRLGSNVWKERKANFAIQSEIQKTQVTMLQQTMILILTLILERMKLGVLTETAKTREKLILVAKSIDC